MTDTNTSPPIATTVTGYLSVGTERVPTAVELSCSAATPTVFEMVVQAPEGIDAPSVGASLSRVDFGKAFVPGFINSGIDMRTGTPLQIAHSSGYHEGEQAELIHIRTSVTAGGIDITLPSEALLTFMADCSRSAPMLPAKSAAPERSLS